MNTQPPLQPVPPPADGPPLASFGDRVLAHLIDLLFLIMVFVLLANICSARWGGLTQAGFEFGGLPAVLVMTLSILAFLAYLILFEGLTGATPGKLLAGLRVCAADGQRCGFGKALARNLLRVADLLTLYLVGAVSKKRQRVGDLAAGTLVVRATPTAGARTAAALLLVACLAVTWGGSAYARRHARVPIIGLAVTGLRFADTASAPARSRAEFKPGEEVRLFYDIDGVTCDTNAQITLLIRCRVLAADGSTVADLDPTPVRQNANLSKNHVNGHVFVRMPAGQAAGTYTLQVTVEDQVAQKTQTVSARFTLTAAAATGAPASPP
jgi:uncharacterized RDD family membrane protein YckC